MHLQRRHVGSSRTILSKPVWPSHICFFFFIFSTTACRRYEANVRNQILLAQYFYILFRTWFARTRLEIVRPAFVDTRGQFLGLTGVNHEKCWMPCKMKIMIIRRKVKLMCISEWDFDRIEFSGSRPMDNQIRHATVYEYIQDKLANLIQRALTNVHVKRGQPRFPVEWRLFIMNWPVRPDAFFIWIIEVMRCMFRFSHTHTHTHTEVAHALPFQVKVSNVHFFLLWLHRANPLTLLHCYCISTETHKMRCSILYNRSVMGPHTYIPLCLHL